MANLDLSTVAPKIAQAKSAGYSDDEIVGYLSSQAPDQFKQAQAAGYSSSEILGHLSSAKLAEKPAETPTEPEKVPDWADVPLEAVKHIPSDIYGIGAGVAHTATSTAKTIAPYATMGIAAPPAMAIDAAKALYNDPGMLKRLPVAVWNSLVDKYGSEDAIKKSLAYHPVSVALDVASVLGGGEAALSKIAGGVSDIGKAADVSKAFHELPPAPATPPPLPTEPPPTGGLAAVREAVAAQPRALTTENRLVQQTAQVASKIPYVGSKLGEAVEAVPEKFGAARDVVAEEMGGTRTPENIASDIRGHLQGAADTERAAAEAAAKQADEAAQAAYERTNREREQAIAQQEQASTQATEQQIGNVEPTVAGDTIGDTVRAAHNAAEARKDRLYDVAGNMNASVTDSAVAPMARNIGMKLEREGITVDDSDAASAARAMMQRLTNFSGVSKAREPGFLVGRTMQDIEQLRKNLNFLSRRATNDADRFAANRIISEFDDWHNKAVNNSMMPGSDPRALPAFQAARDANTEWRNAFGYNKRNDADTILNKMVQPGDRIGPDEIANALHAGTNKSARLLDAIYQATADHPNHPNVVQAVRGSIYNKLTTDKEGLPFAPEKTAKNIGTFLGNREMVNRVWTPQDQAIARNHITTLRDAAVARDEAAAAAKAGKPVPTEIVKGPMQELAKSVLGGGQEPHEAIFKAIEGYAKGSGGGKDLDNLAGVMRLIPESLRGNFRNQFVRRLGNGPDGEFSAKKFADAWQNNVNARAKMVLMGDGSHVRALDELAEASRKFDDIHKRFGNPSGSGQHVNAGAIAKMVAGVKLAGGVLAFINPLKAAALTYGARGVADLLATPAGAMSMSRMARTYQHLHSAPSMAAAAATRLAQRNVRNTAIGLGIIPKREDQ